MRKFVTTAAALALIAGLGGCGIFRGGAKKTPVLGERVPILMSENSLTADASIDSIAITLPPPEANASWAQPGGSAAKSLGHLAFGEAPTQLWQVSIPGGDTRVRLAASPTIDGGKLFVADTLGNVRAYAADTGASLWVKSTVKDDANSRARFGGGASAEGGRVFATNGIGDVVALEADSGNEVWRAKPGGPLRGSPTLANGIVYVVSQDNQLFALSQTDGSVVWTQSGSIETQGVFGVAAPASAQGTVVAGFSSGELNAYRYENGRSLWGDALARTSATTSVSSLADIDAEPVIDQGRVYAIGQGGRMVALDLGTGQRLWEQNLAGISTPWVAGEWIFVVTDDARLICLARSSGKVRWIKQLRRYRVEKKEANKSKDPVGWSGPILAGGSLWLTNTLGQVVSVSPDNGDQRSIIRTKKFRFTLSPVLANSTLYTLSDGGTLTAFR